MRAALVVVVALLAALVARAQELATGDVELPALGEARPFSQREPSLGSLTLELDLHYGLVGTGPTVGTADMRFGIFDWWEVRTGALPHALGMSSRFRLGSVRDALGAFVVDGGLSGVELGAFEDDEATALAVRFYLHGGVEWWRTFGDRLALTAAARYRARLSTGRDEDEHIVAGEARVIWDLPGRVTLSGGVAGAHSFTPVRELAVAFVELGQPGLSHFLVRIDEQRASVTVPLAISYGLSDAFDIDVFATPRVYPQLDAILGAGVRWRFAFSSLREELP